MTLQQIKNLSNLINKEILSLKESGRLAHGESSETNIDELIPMIINKLCLPIDRGIQNFIKTSIRYHCE